MRCSNCGAELTNGSLICPRCGARQAGGGNGGNGKVRNGGNGRNGGGGKIVAIVASLILVAVGTIVGINVTRNNTNASSSFTHDTTFNKDNLTITDENTLRYRDVANTKSFNVGSEKGFVEVKIVDEQGFNANFKVDKAQKNDRYIIKPDGVWDNTHTYYMYLGEDTYFTDEDMFKFKNVIYSIKRETVSDININQDIKDMTSYTDIEISKNTKVGDIVLKKDKNDELVCLKVENNVGGVVTYSEPTLDEVFKDLNVNNTFKPDYSSVKWNQEIGIKMAYNVARSPFFEALVQTVYAEGNSDYVYGQVLSDISEYVTCTPYKVNNGLGAKVIITLPKLDKNVFNAIDVNGSIVVTIDVSNSFEFKPDIDFRDEKNIKFDMQFYTYPSSSIKIDITGEANVTDDAIKRAWDAIKDYDSYVELCDTEIPIPGASIKAGVIKGGIFVHVPMGFVPKFAATVNFNYSHERNSMIKFGIGIVNGELVPDYVNNLTKDEINLHMDGQLYASMGVRIEPKVSFEISASADIGVAEGHAAAVAAVGFGAEVGPYVEFKGQYDGKWDKVSGTSNVEGNCDLELGVYYIFDINGNLKINLGYGYIDLKGTLKSGWDAFWTGAEPKRQMHTKELIDIDEKLYYELLNEHVPLIQIGGYIDNNGADVATAINVGAVGSTMMLGPYSFRVIDKNEMNGTALLVAVEGLDSKPYTDNSNNNIGTAGGWAASTLRKYLNEQFVKSFSAAELSSIYENVVKAEKNEKYGIDGGKDSTDKIFILSKSELEKYLKSDAERQAKASGTAVAAGAYVSTETDASAHKLTGNTVYWVRNPGNMTINAMAVNSDGSINEEGAPVSRNDICVRPALWIRYAIRGTQVSDRLKNANKAAINTSSVK